MRRETAITRMGGCLSSRCNKIVTILLLDFFLTKPSSTRLMQQVSGDPNCQAFSGERRFNSFTSR